MIERCEKARLSLEPLSSLFTFKELFRQYLYRDLSIEARVFRPVDLSHSARADRDQNLVRPEAGTR